MYKKFFLVIFFNLSFSEKKILHLESIYFDTLDKEAVKNYLDCILASVRCVLEDCGVAVNPSYLEDKHLLINYFKFPVAHFENENFKFVRSLKSSQFSALLSLIDEKFTQEEKKKYEKSINFLKEPICIEENVCGKTYEWFVRKLNRQSTERLIDYICFIESIFYCAEKNLNKDNIEKELDLLYLKKKIFILSIEKKYRMFFDNDDFGFDEVFLNDENFVIKNLEIFNYLKKISHRFPLYLSILEEKLNPEEKERYKKEIDFLRNRSYIK